MVLEQPGILTGRSLQGMHPLWNFIWNYLAMSIPHNDKIISIFFRVFGNHTGHLNKLHPMYFLPIIKCVYFSFNAPRHTVRTLTLSACLCSVTKRNCQILVVSILQMAQYILNEV